MQITRKLGDEHFWIRHLLDCLEQVAAAAGEHGQVDPEASSELLYLFESFADGQHQTKEEAALFPGILDKASPGEQEYLKKLLSDHVAEREHMERMRSQLDGAIYGEPLCVRDFVRAAGAYVELHRKHMAHENTVLLPMVERTLTPTDDAEILEGFREIELAGPDPTGIVERIKSLCRRLDVPIARGPLDYEPGS